MRDKRLTLRATEKLVNNLHLIARSQGRFSNGLVCEVLQSYVDTFDITTISVPQPAIEQVVITKRIFSNPNDR